MSQALPLLYVPPDPTEAMQAVRDNFELISAQWPEVGSAWRYVGAAGEPAFQNGWGNFNPVYTGACYRRIGNTVFLRGLITGGVVGYGTPAFTLTANYQAPEEQEFAVSSNGAFGVIYVGTSNKVAPSTAGQVAVAVGVNVYVDLSPVSYSVDA